MWIKEAFHEEKSSVKIFSEEEASNRLKKIQAESEPEKEFQSLLQSYYNTLSFTMGSSTRQLIVDKSWEALKSFAAKHPEFSSHISQKQSTLSLEEQFEKLLENYQFAMQMREWGVPPGMFSATDQAITTFEEFVKQHPQAVNRQKK